jgi:hypothetical protein
LFCSADAGACVQLLDVDALVDQRLRGREIALQDRVGETVRPNRGRDRGVLRVEQLDSRQARGPAALRVRERFDGAGGGAVKLYFDRGTVELEFAVGLGRGGDG